MSVYACLNGEENWKRILVNAPVVYPEGIVKFNKETTAQSFRVAIEKFDGEFGERMMGISEVQWIGCDSPELDCPDEVVDSTRYSNNQQQYRHFAVDPGMDTITIHSGFILNVKKG